MLKEHLEYRLNRDSKTINNKLTLEQCALEKGLTKREETILRSLLNSDSNEDICDKLCITNNTLKKHILNIYRKLEIKNRNQLLKKFI